MKPVFLSFYFHTGEQGQIPHPLIPGHLLQSGAKPHIYFEIFGHRRHVVLNVEGTAGLRGFVLNQCRCAVPLHRPITWLSSRNPP